MSADRGWRRWQQIFQQKPEHEVDDELSFHQEHRIREYIERGMTPEAARQAGIYAMMSFTVNRRRREIGIRTALGADARRVLTGIFTRASAQLGIGIGTGLALAAAFEWIGPGSIMGDRALIILPAVAAILFAVGVLAALGPARRGLSVQPTEALRE